MTGDAKSEIMAILILTQRRIRYKPRLLPFISSMLKAYYREWGWYREQT